MRTRTFGWLFAGLLTLLPALNSYASGATVLYGDQTFVIDAVLDSGTDLWVTPKDLTRISGFVLKPEGACLEDLCIPIVQSEDSRLFVRRNGQGFVNVTELARKVQQPFVSDANASVWSFGALPTVRRPFLESAIAPNFTLTDRNGEIVRLSDFLGKKVMIITWASW